MSTNVASIFTMFGEKITTGLPVSAVSDEAFRAAQRIAAHRGEAVVLADDDGEWIIQPDGSATLTTDVDGDSVVCTNDAYCPTMETFASVDAFVAMCQDVFGFAPTIRWNGRSYTDETGAVVLRTL